MLAYIKRQRLDLFEQTGLCQLLNHLIFNWMIDIKQRYCFGAGGGAAQGKVGNIDAVFAHRLTQSSDNAGDIFVCGIEHMRTNLGINIDAFDLDKPRLSIAKDRARNGTLTLIRDNGHFDVA